MHLKLQTSVLNDVCIMDMTTFNWMTIQSFGSIPSARWGHASVVDGTKMYIFGGICGTSTARNQIFCLDTEMNAVKEKIDEEMNTIKKKELIQKSSMEEFESLLSEFDNKLQIRISKHSHQYGPNHPL